MLSDYHVHSSFSLDSEEEPEKIINRAIHLNMKQICFTEHCEIRYPVPNEPFILDTGNYISYINELKDKYKNQIQVLCGVELGLTPESETLKRQQYISDYHFDYIIGSCHAVDNKDPYYPEFWENRTDRAAFELYFNTLLNSIREFHNFNTLGHLDYVVRYSPNGDSNYSVLDYRDIIDEILNFIINKNINLEINTSNLAKGFNFPNPHTDIIKRYKELGGQFVAIGSDAHNATNIGYAFDKIEELIKHMGLFIYTV